MTEVVLSVEPNPKRVNSGAWHRYARYYVGAAEADLLALGLTPADLRWDRRQSHVAWGSGERREPPEDLQALSRAVGEGGPGTPVAPGGSPRALEKPRGRGGRGTTETTATTRTPRGGIAATAALDGGSETALETPRALASLALPAGRITRDVAGVDLVASWWCRPTEVEATAPPAEQSRTWTVRARVEGGETYSRSVRGDRSAANLVAATAAHGLDPDDWRLGR